MKEIVKEGQIGLHFKPGASEDLASKIEWALDHKEKMSEMGKKARKEFEKKYVAEENYKQLMGIYQFTLDKKRKQVRGKI